MPRYLKLTFKPESGPSIRKLALVPNLPRLAVGKRLWLVNALRRALFVSALPSARDG
jgi:hypothetical protein